MKRRQNHMAEALKRPPRFLAYTPPTGESAEIVLLWTGMEAHMPKWFTSVELDEGLFAKALRLSQAKTKKEFFDLAIRTYVRLHEQAEVTQLRGKLVWKSVDKE